MVNNVCMSNFQPSASVPQPISGKSIKAAGINYTITSSSKINIMQLIIVIAVAFLLLGGAKAQQQQEQDGGRWMIYSQRFLIVHLSYNI